MNRSLINHGIQMRAASLAVLSIIAGQAAAVAAPAPPNIAFIIADDMGFGDPGCTTRRAKSTQRGDKQKDIVTSLTTLLERYQKDGHSVPSRK